MVTDLGLTCRDQLVSRWQTPVAACCVTATSLNVSRTGEAMALVSISLSLSLLLTFIYIVAICSHMNSCPNTWLLTRVCYGEKPTIALISPAASARMAVAESLLNLASSDMLDGLRRVRMSCNRMTAIVICSRFMPRGTIPTANYASCVYTCYLLDEHGSLQSYLRIRD